jgi:hypothetical protein
VGIPSLPAVNRRGVINLNVKHFSYRLQQDYAVVHMYRIESQSNPEACNDIAYVENDRGTAGGGDIRRMRR